MVISLESVHNIIDIYVKYYLFIYTYIPDCRVVAQHRASQPNTITTTMNYWPQMI